MAHNGTVKEVAAHLAKAQNEGWPGSRSIHSREGQIRRRIKRLKKLERENEKPKSKA